MHTVAYPYRAARSRGAFTLIEILVVVAIIALLIAILLPSLAAAKEAAKTAMCLSNIKQLGTAFQMYATEYGRYPGSMHDENMDWIGFENRNKIDPTLPAGRCPEDGTIYKYMGKMQAAYTCPKDKAPKELPLNFSTWFSYTYNSLMVMAKPETATAAHYPDSKPDYARASGSTVDHTTNMRPFEGVPLVVEPASVQIKATYGGTTGDIDARWIKGDRLTARHNQHNGNRKEGAASIAFNDGHANTVRLGGPTDEEANIENPPEGKYFEANYMCIRTSRGKWVSGFQANANPSTARMLELAPPADSGNEVKFLSGWKWTPTKTVRHLGVN